MARVRVLAAPSPGRARAILQDAAARGVTYADLVESLDAQGYDPTPILQALGGGGMSGWWSDFKRAAGGTVRGAFEVAGMGTIGNAVVRASDKMTRALESVIGEEASKAADRAAQRFIDMLPLSTRIKGGLYASWPVWAGIGTIGAVYLVMRRR